MSIRSVIHIGDSAYPDHVRTADGPPERLYCIGDTSLLAPGLAVIGSRKATPYGITAAGMFAGYAASHGAPVISGAAMGCDQAAHRAAIDVGGPTVAVLGCGADVDYPSGAARLLNAIRSDGLVVSLLPWGARPTRYTFVNRNRLIALLCEALLVVEAAIPSGTFSTVEFAIDIGREVLAVPGSIFAPECRGPNRLLCQGAGAIADVSDLANALRLSFATQPTPADERRSIASGPLLDALRANPMRPDDAAFALGLDIVDIAESIGDLVRAGEVVRFPGGRYGVVKAAPKRPSEATMPT